jgi:hypothetical protein
MLPPTMVHVFEWCSYACNNSSDQRLVAEFATAARATAMGKELATVLREHARQAEAALAGGGFDAAAGEPSPALIAFAAKHGCTVDGGLRWTDDDSYVDDPPEIATIGRALVLYHHMMADDFGVLAPILERAGARVATAAGTPWLRFEVMAKPPRASGLRAAIDAMLAPEDGDDAPPGYLIERGDERTVFARALGAEDAKELTAWLKKQGASSVEVALFGADEAAALRRSESVPSPLVEVVAAAGDPARAHLGGVVVEWTTLYLVGGRGSGRMLKAKVGAPLAEVALAGAPGLRALAVHKAQMWTVGDDGFVGVAKDGEALPKHRIYAAAVATSFASVDEATRADRGCLRAIAYAADGSLWVGGDAGYLARIASPRTVRPADNLTPIAGIGGTIHQLVATPTGVLAVTDDGLFVVADAPLATGLSAPVVAASPTMQGALLAIGPDAVHRSDDGGRSFRPVTLPPLDGARLTAIAVHRAAVVVAGERGVVLASLDDGATFHRLAHDAAAVDLAAAFVLGDRVVLTGEGGAVLALDPRRLA